MSVFYNSIAAPHCFNLKVSRCLERCLGPMAPRTTNSWLKYSIFYPLHIPCGQMERICSGNWICNPELMLVSVLASETLHLFMLIYCGASMKQVDLMNSGSM